MDMMANAYVTLAWGLLAYILGYLVCARCKRLQDLTIPVPVVGGLIGSVVFSALKYGGFVDVTFDMFFFECFMAMFFCSTGFFIALNSKKIVGHIARIALFMALLIVAQNLVALTVACFFSQPLVYSVCIGSVPMVGSFGSVGVFGSLAEELGVQNGVLSGMIMALMGIIGGGILGAPIALSLLRKYGISGTDEAQVTATDEATITGKYSATKMIYALLLLGLCMYVGYACQQYFLRYNIKLPVYTGGIVLAVALNNLGLYYNKDLLKREMGVLSNVSLNIFLSISLMTLDLTIISKIAAPVTVCMALQVALIYFFSRLFMYLWEKSYVNVLFVAGFIGFGLGALPTGMANVNAIIKRHGYNNHIYLLLPLASSLCDCINGTIAIVMINVLS